MTGNMCAWNRIESKRPKRLAPVSSSNPQPPWIADNAMKIDCAAAPPPTPHPLCTKSGVSVCQCVSVYALHYGSIMGVYTLNSVNGFNGRVIIKRATAWGDVFLLSVAGLRGQPWGGQSHVGVAFVLSWRGLNEAPYVTSKCPTCRTWRQGVTSGHGVRILSTILTEIRNPEMPSAKTNQRKPERKWAGVNRLTSSVQSKHSITIKSSVLIRSLAAASAASAPSRIPSGASASSGLCHLFLFLWWRIILKVARDFSRKLLPGFQRTCANETGSIDRN